MAKKVKPKNDGKFEAHVVGGPNADPAAVEEIASVGKALADHLNRTSGSAAAAETNDNEAGKEPTKTHTWNYATRGKHEPFIKWYLARLPKMYTTKLVQTDTGYKVEVDHGDSGDENFVTVYMSSLANYLKTIDEQGPTITDWKRKYPDEQVIQDL